ncbi:MAG: ribosomal protein S18-alanine N-acetyltransferase [Gemmatimonadetes bacterium]|nr:ribosomal protein S18-alanine N-acetyltransferase [Gemmatimonadota bacterium]
MTKLAPRPVLRDMAAADLRAVMTIERSAFDEPWPESAFSGLLARGDALHTVATAGKTGCVVGYSVTLVQGRLAQLANLAVAEGARRRGLGRRLAREAVAASALRGARRIFLEVREGNVPALTLYEELGFEALSVRPDYYSNPSEDAIVLARTTGPPRPHESS